MLAAIVVLVVLFVAASLSAHCPLVIFELRYWPYAIVPPRMRVPISTTMVQGQAAKSRNGLPVVLEVSTVVWAGPPGRIPE